MFNAIRQWWTSRLKGLLYLITFKLIFTILKYTFGLIVNILASGYYLLLFYLIAGAYAYLFMELRFDGNTLGNVYIVGAVFWFIVSTVVMLRMLKEKIVARAVKQEYEKRFKLMKGEIEYNIRNRKTLNRAEQKLERRRILAEYFAEDVIDSYYPRG